MKIYTKTDIGLVRTENQDSVWGAMLSPNVCAAVLCDGMGGESEGGLASTIAVDVVSKRIAENFNEKMSRNSVRNLLITSVVAANTFVWDTARTKVRQVMGTTCVAAIVFGGTAYIVNVGDSRAYHLFTQGDDECIRQITKDHTHVQDLLDRGEITEDMVKTHAERHKITRAIGADDSVTPDYFEMPLEPGDKLLLCSDGLSSYGDDMDILDICFDSKSENCCDELIRYALKNGGHDNVSVALFAP
ncbi:MAG: protein phosphatase 2C domain-containing protein [Oscillospiraceae bacterium]|nr:protein phosphatase 2C domain-containing protein [Oscillospiraceae bacterium]